MDSLLLVLIPFFIPTNMNKYSFLSVVGFLCINFYVQSQNIGDFTSVEPLGQSDQFILPSSHTFQKIAETGDALTVGSGTLPRNPDFTGFVTIAGSSTNGYLSLNHEIAPGAVTIFDINFNTTTKFWETTASEAIDFSSVFVTGANCSGTVTPWGTVISSEEFAVTWDYNSDGYNDTGWNVEINPVTKSVIGKHWAMGNFQHENVSIHSNERTVYQGADSNPGYLYKYVANEAQDLSSGLLYVYKGSKNGSGDWILINNTTQTDQNTTILQSAALGATEFAGIEDVEIGPDGMVYFAVKSENQIYRFQDSDPISGTTVPAMETYVGNMNYTIDYGSGSSSVPWSYGNDNLAFDGDGNLWVFQDGDLKNGDHNYIWVVKSGHTQANPKVEIFAITPTGSEPTGITFTPDYKYLFMSIQHPDSGNTANQTDASGATISFSKGTTLVIALKGNLGTTLSTSNSIENVDKIEVYPNPTDAFNSLIIKGNHIETIKLFSINGKLLEEKQYQGLNEAKLNLTGLQSGFYLININNEVVKKLIIK
ncbi:alkaline phosphatase PhoX [Yeosuana marina]|uniref:alkaline phosphatase PhoX n=1 Tax=Yeosuana marina TaxID=1565536 RepID=UPI0030EC9709|tara:strand:+ start:4936 stop:6549 length:1614 start_codon:yes stop_codon:yes gene_type:complete